MSARNAQLTLKDPAELRPHPLRKHVPAPDPETDPSYKALLLAVRDSGVREPLLIDSQGHVAKGWRRRCAAKALQLAEVPCIVIADHEAGVVFMEGLLTRRRITAGAAVYLLVPSFEAVIKSANDRRLANLKRTGKEPFYAPLDAREILKNPNDLPNSGTTVRDLIERLGVNEQTFRKAVEVHRVFHDPRQAQIRTWLNASSKRVSVEQLPALQAELKAEFEPLLLNGERSVWNIMPALAGRITGGEHREAEAQLTFDFAPIHNIARRWNKLESDERKKFLAGWRELFESIPNELRDALADMLERGTA
jgi:hypothetical protein